MKVKNTSSDPRELLVTRLKVSTKTGDPAPCAELEPTSSWSNKATIRIPTSSLKSDEESISAYNPT